MKRIRRVIKSFVQKFCRIIRLVTEEKDLTAECYFPEFIDRRKSKTRIFLDQSRNIIKYGEPNKFYFLYGLDIKDFNRIEDFVDYSLFMRRRNEMNYRQIWYPPICVLRDKALFGVVADAYGITTPQNIGLIENGRIFLYEKKVSLSLKEYLASLPANQDFFLKTVFGECADGVFHVLVKNGSLFYKGDPVNIDTFLNPKHRYLFQATIHNQNPVIAAIHPNAINTLRLVTVLNLKTGEIEVLSCVLRVGVGNNNVDNWAAGGLSVGVDTEKGCLRKYGFYKPGFGTKVTEQPDSHIVFEGYSIPFLKEAISQAKEFHRQLYGMHSIGWDIAITNCGPCFVEANDNWEISLMQISNYGLQKQFDRLFY